MHSVVLESVLLLAMVCVSSATEGKAAVEARGATATEGKANGRRGHFGQGHRTRPANNYPTYSRVGKRLAPMDIIKS